MLVTHHFLFTAEVTSPLELDDHSGAALRGNLFDALWQRFCTNKTSPSCANCPLHALCPVSALVAPLREEQPGRRDIPRPYIILPPLGRARRYEPGETLIFGLTLFGKIIQLLPYIVMSVGLLEAGGLGHKLQENAGRRGTFHIKQIESYQPMTGERQTIYHKGRPIVQAPALSVTAADIINQAATLPTEKLTLDFLTPTRLVDQELLVRQISFRSLVLRLRQRLTNLTAEYGEEPLTDPQAPEINLITLAEDIKTVKDETHWEEVNSYSRRQQRSMPISGLMGQVTFAGHLEPFRELLVWGELIHVGKNVVKGNGWYKIVASSALKTLSEYPQS